MAHFSWKNQGDSALRIKAFLAQRGVSHRMFAVLTWRRASLLNHKPVRTIDDVAPGDLVEVKDAC